MNAYIKIIAPLMQFVLAVIVFMATMFSYIGLEFVGMSPFNGFVEIPIILITLGLLICWYGEKVILQLEGLRQPSIIVHLRHSCLLYAIGIYNLVLVIERGGTGGLDAAYMAIIFTVMIFTAFVNAVYLWRLKSRTDKN